MPFPGRVGIGVSVTEPRNLCLIFPVVLMQGVHRELRDSSVAAFIRFSRNKGPQGHHNVLHLGLSGNNSVQFELPDSGPGWALGGCSSVPVGQPACATLGLGRYRWQCLLWPQSSCAPHPILPLPTRAAGPVLQVVLFQWVTGMRVCACVQKQTSQCLGSVLGK